MPRKLVDDVCMVTLDLQHTWGSGWNIHQYHDYYICKLCAPPVDEAPCTNILFHLHPLDIHNIRRPRHPHKGLGWIGNNDASSHDAAEVMTKNFCFDSHLDQHQWRSTRLSYIWERRASPQ